MTALECLPQRDFSFVVTKTFSDFKQPKRKSHRPYVSNIVRTKYSFCYCKKRKKS